MSLKAAQKSQLLAAYAMVGEYRREMEDLVRGGRPPAGSTARLRPLPAAEAEALLEPLSAVQQQLRQGIRDLTGDDPDVGQTTQPLRGTRIWAANVLDRVRDSLDSVAPDRLSPRYGPMSKADAESLRELRRELGELLEEARKGLRG